MVQSRIASLLRRKVMRTRVRLIVVSGGLLLFVAGALAYPDPANHGTIVITFKDGHHTSLAAGEITRIDLKASAIVYNDGHKEKITSDVERIEFSEPDVTAATPGRNHFVGKWEVGEGNGGKFFITLEENGNAKKTIGSVHGTWTLVDGEAHIAWDDGWHDAIRKVGSKHEKIAFEPGKTFSDKPSNVTAARNTEPKPI
jgi:hypothetical protein